MKSFALSIPKATSTLSCLTVFFWKCSAKQQKKSLGSSCWPARPVEAVPWESYVHIPGWPWCCQDVQTPGKHFLMCSDPYHSGVIKPPLSLGVKFRSSVMLPSLSMLWQAPSCGLEGLYPNPQGRFPVLPSGMLVPCPWVWLPRVPQWKVPLLVWMTASIRVKTLHLLMSLFTCPSYRGDSSSSVRFFLRWIS